jgi:hypothetical protein
MRSAGCRSISNCWAREMKYWTKSKETNMSGALARKLTERERPAGQLLIIGYGNPLRGDDGIGWQISDQLARRE